MKHWPFLLALFAVPCFAVDPLAPQFFPSIDQVAGDYNTSLGTITVTSSLYKVFQSSTAPGNLHWAIVYAMQNEIQAFQVHVTPTVNITSLTVTVSNLTNAQTGTIIYSTSTDIVVYREFYMQMSTPTALSSITYSSGFRGWVPDQLIPSKDPYYHQTTNAFPIAVTAGNTQSAWIDVHIPTNAPSGYYSGSVYVSSGAVVVSTMPVVYGVWAWLMPSTSSLPMVGSGFGYNGFNNIAYNGSTTCTYPNSGTSCDGANVYEWIDGAVQMLDNRYTIDTPNYIYPGSGSYATFNSLIGPLLNGTPANTSTILPGAAITSIMVPQAGGQFSQAVFSNAATNFASSGWTSRLFEYLQDEPTSGQWTAIISSGNATRGWATPVIPNLVTTDLATASSFNGQYVIDWITPIVEELDKVAVGNLRSTYDSYLLTSSGTVRKIGSYQDCESAGTCSQGTIGPANTPPYPNHHIDGTAVANRAFETWAWTENINYQLYFAVDICDNSSANYPCAGATYNPWITTYAFGCNGDGTLMYPSTSTYVTFSVAQSTPIWIPSFRLKQYRDGEQDYEYEKYLTAAGQGTLVNTQIATWMANAYNFNNDPTKLEAARLVMGNAIHQLTYPGGKSLSGTGKVSGGGTFY